MPKNKAPRADRSDFAGPRLRKHIVLSPLSTRRGTEVVVTGPTRNRVVGSYPARGFESHPLRHFFPVPVHDRRPLPDHSSRQPQRRAWKRVDSRFLRLSTTGEYCMVPVIVSSSKTACGEVTEWLKVHAWNACVRKYREFESHPLRHINLFFSVIAGSCATKSRKPRQVREEATVVSNFVCRSVPGYPFFAPCPT